MPSSTHAPEADVPPIIVQTTTQHFPSGSGGSGSFEGAPGADGSGGGDRQLALAQPAGTPGWAGFDEDAGWVPPPLPPPPPPPHSSAALAAPP